MMWEKMLIVFSGSRSNRWQETEEEVVEGKGYVK